MTTPSKPDPVPDVSGAPRFHPPTAGRWRPVQRTRFGPWRAHVPGALEYDAQLHSTREQCQSRCNELNQRELDRHG